MGAGSSAKPSDSLVRDSQHERGYGHHERAKANGGGEHYANDQEGE